MFPFSPDQAILDVLVNGRVKEDVILLDKANLVAPPLDVKLREQPLPNGNNPVAEPQYLEPSQFSDWQGKLHT
jgi:hypothetical protein